MELGPFDHEITLHRVTSRQDVERWQDPFARTYQTVFRGEPYREEFSLEKARGVFRMLTGLRDHITLIAARGADEVVGFGIAVPLVAMQTIAPRLEGLVQPKHTYYLAELGVLPEIRHRGLGKALIRERIRLMDTARYSAVVLRVSDEENRSAEMYQSLDFEDMGVRMTVTRPRVGGGLQTDTRRFLCRLLSQVDVE